MKRQLLKASSAILVVAVSLATSCKPKQVKNPGKDLLPDSLVKVATPPVIDTVVKKIEPAPQPLPTPAPMPEPAPAPAPAPAPTYVKTKTLASAKLYNQSFYGKDARFWGVSSNKVFSIKELSLKNTKNQSKVDFAFVTRKNGNLLVSPASQDATDIYGSAATPKQWENDKVSISTWEKRRNTSFVLTSITKADIKAQADKNYDVLIQNAIKSVGEPSAASIVIGDLNNAILFKNEDGKYGLILIEDLKGKLSSNGVAEEGFVKFVVYVQE